MISVINIRMCQKHADRVNVIKSVKVSGKWRFATVVERDGEIVVDHVWIAGKDEYHPEGRYFFEWHEHGKRRRETISTPGRLTESARRKHTELNGSRLPAASLRAPATLGGNRILTGNAVQQYLEFIKVHRSHRTFLSYRATLKSLGKSYHRIYVDQVRRDDILDFITYSYKCGLTNRTVYNHLVVVLQLFKRYGQTELIESSDWPTYVETIRPIYEAEEIKAMFQHARQNEQIFLKFLLVSGFRDREAQCLIWRDIDLHNCIVRVTAKPIWDFVPKNWEERIVPLPLAMVKQFRDLKEHSNASAVDLVFPNSKGRPDRDNDMIVKRVAERAGLNCRQCITRYGNKCAEGPYCQNFFLHKFRYTFATEHLRHGVDIRTLQTWMGHRDIKSTMIYVKGFASKEALDKVNAGLLAAYVT